MDRTGNETIRTKKTGMKIVTAYVMRIAKTGCWGKGGAPDQSAHGRLGLGRARKADPSRVRSVSIESSGGEKIRSLGSGKLCIHRKLPLIMNTYIGKQTVVCRSQWPLWLLELEYWDYGFESHSRHGNIDVPDYAVVCKPPFQGVLLNCHHIPKTESVVPYKNGCSWGNQRRCMNCNGTYYIGVGPGLRHGTPRQSPIMNEENHGTGACPGFQQSPSRIQGLLNAVSNSDCI
jgi:hypothetical protein